MKRSSNLVPLVAGFAVMLLLLAAVSAIGISDIRALSAQMTTIVAERNQKAELASTMYALHRARHQTLQLITYMTDPFERDAEIQHFRALAREFIRARDQFLSMPLDPVERGLWERIRSDVRTVEQLSDRILNLINTGRRDEARKILRDQVAPHQRQMMANWAKLVALQHRYNEDAVKRADGMRARTQRLTLTLSGLALLVGVMVAGFVIRLNQRLQNALIEEKEMDQVTLESMGDAVIRVDANGRISYVNPGAESLLGQTNTESAGQQATELLQMFDRESRTSRSDAILREARVGKQVNIPPNTGLLSRSGLELEVEGRLTPIHSADGALQGSVAVLRDVTESHELQRRLAWHAEHDDLTGLFNRRSLEERLAKMINGKRTSDHPLSLLYLDLDRFKQVNDNGGHAAGDELLRQITRLMLLRTRETDMVARMGGDEFAILLIACPSDVAERIAESVRDAIQSYRLVWEGRTYQVGASIGVVHAPPTWETLDDCLNAADAAAYRAKDLGRNRVVVHRHEESQHA